MMKQWKRAICAILALVLSAASFNCGLALVTKATGTGDKTPGAVVTGIEGINLMDNAGFENNTASLQNWGYPSVVTVNTNTDYTHSGTVSAKVSAGQTGEAYAYCNTTVDYNRNAAFTAGMWVYLSEPTDAQKVTLFLERPDSLDGTVTAKPQEISGWQRVDILGEPTQNTSRQAIKFVVAPGNQGDIYFDDAFVYCADTQSVNLIRNGGFNTNKDTWADASWFDITTEQTYSGTGAAKLTGARNIFQATGWWPNRTSTETGSELFYSTWVKGGENAGSITLRVEVKAGNTSNYYSETLSGTMDQWQRLSVSIPCQENKVQEMLFHITTTGEGVFYVDDVLLNDIAIEQEAPDVTEPEGDKVPDTVITEETGENLMKNPGFEESAAALNQWSQEGASVNTDAAFTHSGAISGKVPGGNTRVIYPYQVITTQDYRSAFRAGIWVYLSDPQDAQWVKLFVETGNGNAEIIQAQPMEGWQKVLVELPEAEDRTNLVMKLEVQAGLTADMYFDDAFFVFTPAEEAPTEPETDPSEPETEPTEPEPTEPETEPTEPETTEPEQASILRNSGLEEQNGDGSITHWDVWPGNPQEGTRQYEVITEDAHSGQKAVKILPVATNAHAIYQYCVDPEMFDFAQSYIASVWVKLEDVNTSALTLGVKRRDAAGKEYNLYTPIPQADTDGWVQVQLEVPGLVDVELVQFDVIVDIGTGSGAIYLDDFDLVTADIPKDNGQKPPAQTGILRNPGLESLNSDGTVLDWDVWPGDPAEGVRQFAVVEGTVHTGSRALRIQPVSTNAHAVYQYCTDRAKFNFAASYQASVWVKLDNVKVSSLTLGVKRRSSDGMEYNLYTAIAQGSTDGWVKVTLDVPGLIGATLTQFDVIVDIGTGTGNVYLDDFSLVPANIPKVQAQKPSDSILRNPGLETLNADGSVLHWDVWPGDPAEGVRNYEVVSDVVHGGNRALKINLQFSNGQAVYQYCVDPESFDFTADYIASVWVKTENMTIYDGTGATLSVKRTDPDGNVHVIKTNVPTGTNDWVQVQLEVPSYRNLDVVQYDVVVDVGAGSGRIYLDDFDLIPAQLLDLPNPNVVQTEEEEPTEKLELIPEECVDLTPHEETKTGDPTWIIVAAAAGLILVMVTAAVLIKRKQ